jgi:hypothetical protein
MAEPLDMDHASIGYIQGRCVPKPNALFSLAHIHDIEAQDILPKSFENTNEVVWQRQRKV